MLIWQYFIMQWLQKVFTRLFKSIIRVYISFLQYEIFKYNQTNFLQSYDTKFDTTFIYKYFLAINYQ